MVFKSKTYAENNPDKVKAVNTIRGIRYVEVMHPYDKEDMSLCKTGKMRLGKKTKTGKKRCVKAKVPPCKKSGQYRIGKPTKLGVRRCAKTF